MRCIAHTMLIGTRIVADHLPPPPSEGWHDPVMASTRKGVPSRILCRAPAAAMETVKTVVVSGFILGVLLGDGGPPLLSLPLQILGRFVEDVDTGLKLTQIPFRYFDARE